MLHQIGTTQHNILIYTIYPVQVTYTVLITDQAVGLNTATKGLRHSPIFRNVRPIPHLISPSNPPPPLPLLTRLFFILNTFHLTNIERERGKVLVEKTTFVAHQFWVHLLLSKEPLNGHTRIAFELLPFPEVECYDKKVSRHFYCLRGFS